MTDQPITTPELEADRRVVRAAALVLIDAALALIEGDPHQFRTRRCQTCRAITSIVGRLFGCMRLAVAATQRGGKAPA